MAKGLLKGGLILFSLILLADLLYSPPRRVWMGTRVKASLSTQLAAPSIENLTKASNTLNSFDSYELKLEVDRSKKKLYLYYNYESSGFKPLIESYSIGSPRQNQDLPEGEYRISRIIWNPPWYPTDEQKARGRTYKPPRHPQNPMGVVKMLLYQNGYDTEVRIHGTNEPHKIGRRVSDGCIRMQNEDASSLAKLLEEELPIKVIVK